MDLAVAPFRRSAVGGRAVRFLVRTALWSVLGLLAGLCLAVTVPYAFGCRSLTVLSGSMEPTIGVGDVVVVREIAPMQARIGDVVTFRDPTDGARLITHRVRDIRVQGRTVLFRTKGDANTTIERWQIGEHGTIGRVLYRVPRIGYVLFWVRGRFGRLLLVVLPALVLGTYELWRIWRPERDAHAADEEVTDGSPS
ncbi:MAG: signal peptidase I [Candidatus Velamenicoccus archaeovorus]